MALKLERLDEIGINELGEGPHWDAETQSLYFVDIVASAIHKYVPSTKKHTKAVLGNIFLILKLFIIIILFCSHLLKTLNF